MVAINEDLIQELMRAVRVKSGFAEVEITELVEACVRDLEIAGIYITDDTDGLARQALKLYCKANYGYDENTERFREAYASLKDSMALSGDYRW